MKGNKNEVFKLSVLIFSFLFCVSSTYDEKQSKQELVLAKKLKPKKKKKTLTAEQKKKRKRNFWILGIAGFTASFVGAVSSN